MDYKEQEYKILKYLKILSEAGEINEGITYFSEAFNIPARSIVNKVIIKNKLIVNNGSKMNPLWRWNTTRPNIKTASRIYNIVLSELREKNSKYHNAKKQLNETGIQLKTTPIYKTKGVVKKRAVKKRVNKTEISLFWGLIKISK